MVVGAELLQALGAATYLAARDAAAVAGAAVLLAAGQQLFYSSLFALISDVAGDGPKDRPFAVAAMVRSAFFGLGGLAAAGLLSVAGPGAYRIAVAVDAVSFAVCALLLALLVRTPAPPAARRGRCRGRPGPAAVRPAVPGPDRDHRAGRASGRTSSSAASPSTCCEDLRAPPWLPGAVLALATGLNSAGGTAAREGHPPHAAHPRRWRWGRRCMRPGARPAWPPWRLPSGWRPAEMLAATVVMAVGGLLFQSRVNALAEAAAPAAAAQQVPGRVPVRVHRARCPGARGRGPVPRWRCGCPGC